MAPRVPNGGGRQKSHRTCAKNPPAESRSLHARSRGVGSSQSAAHERQTIRVSDVLRLPVRFYPKRMKVPSLFPVTIMPGTYWEETLTG